MSNQTFPRKLRLASPKLDGDRTSNKKVTSNSLLLLAKPNGLTYPRLGMVVPKRFIKRAVDRNQIKRLFRESFRHRLKQLQNLDIVISVRGPLPCSDNSILWHHINLLWTRLIGC